MDDDSQTLEKGVLNLTTVSSGTVSQTITDTPLAKPCYMYTYLFSGAGVSIGLWTMCLQSTKSPEL